MENNLEDILVDNIEEKPAPKSKVRILIIAVASVVLLTVLGILAYVLLKGEPQKNPEFNNAELEKIIPQESQSQPDDLDKLIAEIKNKETPTQASTPAENQPQEKSSNTPTQEVALLTNTQAVSQQPAKKIQEPLNNAEKAQTSQSNIAKKEDKKEPQMPTKSTSKPEKKESKASKPAKKVEKKPAVSASKAFESIKTPSAPKGFYLQVGVFGGKPQKAFISKLSSYQYKTETIQRNGKVLTRYLVGPYTSKDQAQSAIFAITQDMGIKPVIIEIK